MRSERAFVPLAAVWGHNTAAESVLSPEEREAVEKQMAEMWTLILELNTHALWGASWPFPFLPSRRPTLGQGEDLLC